MIVQLGFPRAGIQVLGQSPDSGESVQRYDYSPAAVRKKGVTSLFEQTKMKLLDSIHHSTKIILLDGVLHLGQSGFKIVQGKLLFDNEPSRQSLQRTAKPINLDDLVIAQC